VFLGFLRVLAIYSYFSLLAVLELVSFNNIKFSFAFVSASSGSSLRLFFFSNEFQFHNVEANVWRPLKQLLRFPTTACGGVACAVP